MKMSPQQQAFGIPEEAERFLRTDFVRLRPGAASRFLPGRQTVETEEFACPSCGQETAPPQHGDVAGCPNCDLRWLSLGNALYVWRDGNK